MTRFFPLPADVVPSLVLPNASSTTSGLAGLSQHDGTAASEASDAPAPEIAVVPGPLSGEAAPAIASPVPTHLPPILDSSSSLLAPPAGLDKDLPSQPIQSYTDHALDPSLLLRVLDILLEEIAKLMAALSILEMRFIGASVLVVYEGDTARLASAIERYDAKQALLRSKPPAPMDKGVINMLDPDDDDEEEDGDDLSDLSDSTSSDDDSLDGAAADARMARRCPPLTLKMIDFAHTRMAEGEGCDEGVLKGLGTLKVLVQGRKREVEEYIEAGKSGV
jgi:1D-myo-inositol-tetrakisphosphate 5-kinase/inositol-polyphosphate multikinase